MYNKYTLLLRRNKAYVHNGVENNEVRFTTLDQLRF